MDLLLAPCRNAAVSAADQEKAALVQESEQRPDAVGDRAHRLPELPIREVCGEMGPIPRSLLRHGILWRDDLRVVRFGERGCIAFFADRTEPVPPMPGRAQPVDGRAAGRRA